MRISLELFLLDNFIMNLLGLRLGECLRGERGRCSRLCALGGALWSLAALSRIPFLLTLPGRIVCLILLTVCTGRRGRYGAVVFPCWQLLSCWEEGCCFCSWPWGSLCKAAGQW